ncbi:hypothetical protein FO519_001637 [Halicephalobus sp. NKZ332]|nr:hypothetical protein FO519_001637 [Halicephalobus sp. NKZ332]
MSCSNVCRLPTLFRVSGERLILRRCFAESSKNVENASEKQQKVYEKPLYATKSSYDANIKYNRATMAADADSGYRPTSLQKWLLVITGLYGNRADIPEYVPTQTMQRLHDRNRVLFIVVATTLFFTFFMIMEFRTSQKIEQDRAKAVMDFLGEKFLAVAGIRKAKMNTEPTNKGDKPQQKVQRERYSPIPAIPSDIGFHSGKKTGGSKSTGVMQNAAGNPAVIVGMGLTTMALLGMIRRSVLGDKIGTQKYMQYRIMAQFFTVTALVAGVTIFGSAYEDPKLDAKTNAH